MAQAFDHHACPPFAWRGAAMGGICSCFDGITNSPAKLHNYLVSIDLATDSADGLIDKLFVDAHSDKTKAKDAIVGEDYKALVASTFEYVLAEYEERKKSKTGDIVHPVEINALKQVVKQTLDPDNKGEITLAALKTSLKKMLDDNDVNEG